MKVTVVTVCFNAADTIAATLLSVASQTHPDIEHIVIDGGSTDETLAQIEAHGAHLARVISEPDHGIYDAMNKGIRLATGDVVGMLNADDVYAAPDVLARVAQRMERESLDAVYGDVAFFHASAPDKTIRRFNSGLFSPARIAWGWIPAHPTLFLKRSVFDSFGLYRTDFRIAGDYEFIARIFKRDTLRYRYFPETLVRMGLGGISTSGWRSTLLLNREVLRACRENGIRTNMIKLLSKYPLKALEFVRK